MDTAAHRAEPSQQGEPSTAVALSVCVGWGRERGGRDVDEGCSGSFVAQIHKPGSTLRANQKGMGSKLRLAGSQALFSSYHLANTG